VEKILLRDINSDREAQQTAQRYQDGSYAVTYKDEYLGGWKFKNLRSRLIARRERAVIKRAFDSVQLSGTILDIPCGTGKLGHILSKYPVQIIAADISPEMMGLAREEYDSAKVLDFVTCDAADIPLKKDEISSVVCLRLTQRLPVDYRAGILAEFNRVASKYLIVSFSISTGWQNLKERMRWLYDRSGFVSFPVSIGGMEDELRLAGYEIIRSWWVMPIVSSQIIVVARKVT
jgi:ubiquinone/menaquinone biosynthesis C-methylase UbiE